MEVHELVVRIKRDHKNLTKVTEPLSITMFDTGKSTTGVNGQFVFSQVLIDCLLRMEANQRDIDELISRCKTEYHGNNTELNKIREFQENYSSDNALSWYTRESFCYRTLNKALRCQNIDMIYLYRSFITDMYRQLQQYQYQSDIPLRVYRSQLMTKDELEDLKRSIGHFISVNSFLSTSKEYSTALFLAGDTNEQTYMERVFFVIDADPKMAISQPFADISVLSEFDESEVLFMVGSIFRLNGISCEADKRWIIQMILCSSDEHDFKDVLAHMKKQNGSGPTNLRTFGKILWQMGKLDLAEKYFKRLLTKLSLNDPVISNVYEDLAQINSQKGDFDNSIQWRKKFLALKNQHQSTGTAHIDNISNSIGKFVEKFDRY
jgi:tetratricopeptide (TPR) repeat protein